MQNVNLTVANFTKNRCKTVDCKLNDSKHYQEEMKHKRM